MAKDRIGKSKEILVPDAEMIRIPDLWIAKSVFTRMMEANPGAKIIEAVRNTINEVYAPRPWKNNQETSNQGK